MTELEKLICEKRLLDDKIRLMKQGAENFGQLENIRYVFKPDTDDKRGWQISAQMSQLHREYETWEDRHEHREPKVEYMTPRWQVFIREETKKEAIDKIKQIISDLNEVINAWSMED